MKRFFIGFAACLMAMSMSVTSLASTMTVAEAKQALAEAKAAEREAKQALKAEKQAYREAAQVIKDETKAVNAEIKEVNARITALRQNFTAVRDAYRSEKVLPNGWTKEDWKAFLAVKKELLAAVNSQPANTEETAVLAETTEAAAAETETVQAELTVKELVAERRFDEALDLLTAKKEARLEKLARRQALLAVWQQIDAMLHP